MVLLMSVIMEKSFFIKRHLTFILAMQSKTLPLYIFRLSFVIGILDDTYYVLNNGNMIINTRGFFFCNYLQTPPNLFFWSVSLSMIYFPIQIIHLADWYFQTYLATVVLTKNLEMMMVRFQTDRQSSLQFLSRLSAISTTTCKGGVISGSSFMPTESSSHT